MKGYTPVPADNDPKYLGIFTRERQFYRTFFGLLIIIAMQQLAALMVNMVDNIMLGRYTELSLSGATLVNQLQFILQQIASGVGLGIVVLASQYWGQQRIPEIKKIIATGLKFGIAAGLIFFLATTFAPRAILSVFTNDAAVIEEGLRYLSIMRWTYLIFAASNSLMYALQSVETVVIGTVMSVSTIIINLCLNYCFIYGNLGAPEMGIRGAAVATLTSRSVELVIILIYVLFIDKKLRMKARDLLSFDSTFLRDYIKISTPVIISGMMWGIGQAAQTAIMGRIGSGVIAANSIATTFQKLFVVFGFACTNVSSVITAKTIGTGKLHLIRSYTKTMQGIFICFGVLIGSVLFVLRGSIVQFYNVSEDTKTLAIAFLTVLSISTLGTCYEFPVESGIISGGGNTRYAPIVDNLFIWLFTIPFSALSVFVFRFPPVVTYCFLKADQLLKCIPNSITVNRYRWVHILTRDTADK